MTKKDVIKLGFLNLSFLLGIVLLFQVSQKNSADVYMEYILSVEEGRYHLYFSHFLLGMILRKLYLICPAVSWYGIMQYTFMYISFFLITYIIAKRFPGNVGKIINILVLLTFGYECYCNPEYTKTALVMIVSAFLLITNFAQRRGKIVYVLGGIWVIIGSLINIRIFWIVLVSWMVLLSVGIIFNGKNIQRAVMLVIASITLVVGGLGVIDDNSYADLEYAWGASRSDLVMLYDFGWPEYSKYVQELSDIQITEDIYMSVKEDRYVAVDWEQINRIAELKRENKYAIESLVRKQNVDEMLQTPWNYVLLTFLLIFCISENEKKVKKCCCFIIPFVVFVFLIYYLGANQSKWLMFALVFIISLEILLNIKELSYDKLKYAMMPYLCIMIYFFYLFNMPSQIGGFGWKADKEDWIDAKRQVMETQYIYDLNSFARKKSVFESYPNDFLSKGNIYMVNHLDYLGNVNEEEAFSMPIVGLYATNSYWCEERENIYAISNSLKNKYGYNVIFTELNTYENSTIYDIIIE